jgi:hypothetical protein
MKRVLSCFWLFLISTLALSSVSSVFQPGGALGGNWSSQTVNLSSSANILGTLQAGNFPALTTDCTTPGASLAITCTALEGTSGSNTIALGNATGNPNMTFFGTGTISVSAATKITVPTGTISVPGLQIGSTNTGMSYSSSGINLSVGGSTAGRFLTSGATFPSEVTLTSEWTSSGGRAFNTGTASDTMAAGVMSTYESANTAAGAFTVTIAAPTADGERRRICFKNTTGVITWTVTSPATATANLPTTLTGASCLEMVFNLTAGTPTNAPANTWIQY